MKRVALSVSVLLLSACGGETPPAQPPTTTTTTTVAATPTATATATATATTPPPAPKKPLAEAQQAASKAIAEAFAAGDAKKLGALYTKDAVFKMAGMPDMAGRDAIEKSAGDWFKSMSKIKVGESRAFLKGDVVVSEWVINAVHSGEFMGAKATDKPVGWQGASVMWFTDDGLVKEEHMYWNPPTVLSQIGASKEKGRAVPALPAKADVIVSQNADAEEAHVKFMSALNHAWDTKNATEFAAVLTDASEWDDLTLPAPAKGKKAVQAYFKSLGLAFPDAKTQSLHVWGIGDWVLEEGTYSGTNTGPLFGSPPTKKPMTIHELTLVQLDKDSKIVKATTYGNDLEMSSQLSPTPAPTPAKK